MAKKKYWYHWTAYFMLLLFSSGILAVSDLPKYYCDKENSFKRCMFLRDNNATCVYVIQQVNGSWSSAGDRCQKGYSRGTWQLTEDFVRIPIDRSDPSIAGRVVNINRPIVMTNTQIYKDTGDRLHVEGYCRSTLAK